MSVETHSLFQGMRTPGLKSEEVELGSSRDPTLQVRSGNLSGEKAVKSGTFCSHRRHRLGVEDTKVGVTVPSVEAVSSLAWALAEMRMLVRN